MKDRPTFKDMFLKYEKIRVAGRHNMLMDAAAVMLDMKLNPRHKRDINIYMDIINNYSKYAAKWL